MVFHVSIYDTAPFTWQTVGFYAFVGFAIHDSLGHTLPTAGRIKQTKCNDRASLQWLLFQSDARLSIIQEFDSSLL